MDRKTSFCILLFTVLAIVPVLSQVSGRVLINRLGVSYQEVIGLDLGLVSYGAWLDEQRTDFVDISLGVESILAKPYIFSPKINIDWGAKAIGDIITLGAGIDVARPTDFSKSTWMITPKVGATVGTLIRIYYGYHVMAEASVHPAIGNHRISLELNTAAFHHFGTRY